MGKYNRFRSLKSGNGFRQVGQAKDYKKAPDDVKQGGLCAAMTMCWLGDVSSSVPLVDKDFGQPAKLQRLQQLYSTKLSETMLECEATEALAAECGLAIRGIWPTAEQFAEEIDYVPPAEGALAWAEKAITYWKGVGSLGTAISQYVRRELGNTTVDPLPCQIGLYLDGFGVSFKPEHANRVKQKWINDFNDKISGAHAVALKRDGAGFRCYDPNAGVYQIDNEAALKTFFDLVPTCYLVFEERIIDECRRNPHHWLANAHVDLELVSITALKSQAVRPMQSGGRAASGDGSRTTAPSITPTPVKPDAELTALLRNYGIRDDADLATLAGFGVNSLYALKDAKDNPAKLEQIKTKLQGRLNLTSALNKLPVEAIDNAIFYSDEPGAEADATKLAEFLAEHDVLARGDKLGRDKLLSLLRAGGVTCLKDLRSIKERAKSDSKRKKLTDNVTAWNEEAGESFESITAAMVAVAGRAGTAVASAQLSAFLAKKGLPPGTETELTGLGITTLEQLREVKAGGAPGQLERLRAKLDNSGILGARQQIDNIQAAEIDYEIAEARSPQGKEATERRAALTTAIREVEALRQRVETAAETNETNVQKRMEQEYRTVLARVKELSGADFDRANAVAITKPNDLIAMLTATINDVTVARATLDNVVEKTPVTLARIIREQDMLCGFLISPAGVIGKFSSRLVTLPASPEEGLFRGPGKTEDFRYTYKGSKTRSFAESTADQSSRTLAIAAQTSGAFFVGSGVAAVSAAAKYADAQKESTDSQSFESATRAECGEIRYIYAPKKAVQFDDNEIRLSEEAGQRLEQIAKLPADQQPDQIIRFYDDYGSHFFRKYTLGGRYELKAEGTSSTETNKGQLVEAVAKATDWAASASGSYAGIGGAGTVGTAVTGGTSTANAAGDRFESSKDKLSVVVEVNTLGGAGQAPRDVWAQSLQYNSTWAVIDRDQPAPVWQLVALDKTLTNDIKAIAPVLEKVWVRQVFLNAVEQSYPSLYKTLNENADINTCAKLDNAVKALNVTLPSATQRQVEPELNVVMAKVTSEPAEWPKVMAGSRQKGLKLIGGGAIVDFPQFDSGGANLLTGSYPMDNCWVAFAKSHVIPCVGTVTAYAIYLEDPNDLWDVKMVSATTEAPSSRPEAKATLPAGYALTGGGASVDWSGPGMMLTACCPEKVNGTYRGWRAKAKDHLEGDIGNATAWVFGIRPTNGVEPTPSVVDVMTKQGSWPKLEGAAESSEEVIVGGAAAVTWKGAGGLLTRCGPSTDQTWKAEAKDHKVSDGSLELTMWLITRKGQLGRTKK